MSNCEKIVIADSIYVDTIIVSVISSSCILCASIFVNYLQHKYLSFISYGCALLCSISLIWSTNTLVTLILTCLYVGLFNKGYNITVSATVLLFPTSLRAMAVSMEMLVGRIGTIVGNLVFPVLLEYGCVAPIINLICFNLLCIVLTCFIPNTRKHAVFT
ncbi:hypothetical protein EAG_15227 [Camponotus floridanus]|uniref:Synaptic vesicle glycoprotein 2B n=2 Tax=Camponotus floridanus TaxID=104421 RepID=E2A2X5_CAMFO|nr:hypothetical protein EAG_15227 [Camponotus floridanus]